MFCTWKFLLILLNSIFLSFASNSGLANVSYNLELNLNLNSSNFDGQLDIQASAIREITEIWLNEGHSKVLDVQIFRKDSLVNCPIELERKNDALLIKISSSMKNGSEFELNISFSGVNFPRYSFLERKSETRWIYLATFDRVFPGLSDPTLKSDFYLKVVDNDQTYRILSNTEEVQNSTTFEPIVNSLQQNVAIAVVPKTMQDSPKEDATIYYRLWSRIKRIDPEDLLQLFSRRLRDTAFYFEEYQPFKYPFRKLDLVVLPTYQVPKTLMANLGLIVFPENILLNRKFNSSKTDRALIRACMGIWLKNVIVPEAEDKTFFIDGLIRYNEYFFHELDFDFSREFLIDVRQKALLGNDLDEDFYVNKAASIFLMMRNTIGHDFHAAMRNFFKARKWKSASIRNLYEAFQPYVRPHKTSRSLIDWFEKDGFPVLNVTIQPGKVVISQSKFGGESNTTWQIPICLSNIGYKNSTCFYLVNQTSNYSEPWMKNVVIVHYKELAGFYRVNYDLKTWENITRILDSEKYASIDEFDRSVLLDDMFNLAKAGYLDYGILFKALKYLKRETKQLPMRTAINNFRALMRIMVTGHNHVPKKLMHFMRNLMDSVLRNPKAKISTELFNFGSYIGSRKYLETNKTTTYCSILKNGSNVGINGILEKLHKLEFSVEVMDIIEALSCYDNIGELKRILNRICTWDQCGLETYNALILKNIYSSSVKKAEMVLRTYVNNSRKWENDFGGKQDQLLQLVAEISKIYQTHTLANLIVQLKEKFFKDAKSRSYIDEILHRMKKDKITSVKIANRVMKYFITGKSKHLDKISIFSTSLIVSVCAIVAIAVAVLLIILVFINPCKKSKK